MPIVLLFKAIKCFLVLSDLKLSPTPSHMNVAFEDGARDEPRTHLIVCVNGEVGMGFHDLLLNNVRKHLTLALPDAKLRFLMSEVNKVRLHLYFWRALWL